MYFRSPSIDGKDKQTTDEASDTKKKLPREDPSCDPAAGAFRYSGAMLPLLRAIGLDELSHRANRAEDLLALCGGFQLDAIVLLQEHD